MDVAIVGGGITGITSALLLKDAGRSVAVLEARSIGSGVTSQSSGHLTQVLDRRYYEIEGKFGVEGSKLVAESGAAAIDQIAALVNRTRSDCGFSRVPGYLYTEREDHVDNLERELEAAQRAGLMSERAVVPLPFVTQAGVRFPDQGQLDPLAYLGALYAPTRVEALASLGAFLGENVDFPLHLLSDSLAPPQAASLDDIKREEGKSIRMDGERLAVYRAPDDTLHAVSPICTHLGCHVKFNVAESSWDCPCHGSRFDIEGRVLNGPAVRNLSHRVVEEGPPPSPREIQPLFVAPAVAEEVPT